ncbi:MAG: cytochrome c3 family protein [Burkholderiales bacterium]|nr:cytochrome c3 family protein [Burkholderiales bacterium]
MIKYFIAAAAVVLFSAVSLPSNTEEVKAGKVSTPIKPASPAVVTTDGSKSGSGEAPSVIKISSSVGEVVFNHQKHIADLGIKCVECHHQINAKKLNTPHPDYLKSSWINCQICHDGSKKNGQPVYACSACHRTNPANIADETLSAKVVIHKQCWKCHAVSTGKEASASCGLCHSGKKKS